MKNILVAILVALTVALGIYAIAQGTSPYNTRTTAEYRQMVGEGK